MLRCQDAELVACRGHAPPVPRRTLLPVSMSAWHRRHTGLHKNSLSGRVSHKCSGSGGDLSSMTVVDNALLDVWAAEIVPGDVSGGTNTSHTIVVAALTRAARRGPGRRARRRLRGGGPRGATCSARTPTARADGRSATYASCTSSVPTRCSSGRCVTFGRSTRRPGRCSLACAPSPATRSSGRAALPSSTAAPG